MSMKRMMLVCLLILCLAPLGAWAETTENVPLSCGDFDYVLLDDGTAKITSYSGGATDLVIPGALDGKPVSTIGNMAFAFNGSLTNVIVPDSVTCIDDEAFLACSSLISVSISDSVKRIGDYVFRGCFKLTSIRLPDSVTNIGANPFRECGVTEIVVSPNHPALYVIDGVLFSRTDGRLICYPFSRQDTEYAIPHGTRIIGTDAFSDLYQLRSVTIPPSVTEIGDFAFINCWNLVDLTLPDSVSNIGDGAFRECRKLAPLMIPESVIRIGTWAFTGCPSPSVVVYEGSYAEQYCTDHDFACVTISRSDAYWDGEWENPEQPYDLGACISNDDIPTFDSDLDAVRVGLAIINSLHEQGQFTNESLFLVAHKTGEELWLFSYASQPLDPGFDLCVVVNGTNGKLVSAWLEE